VVGRANKTLHAAGCDEAARAAVRTRLRTCPADAFVVVKSAKGRSGAAPAFGFFG
jgi:hypothetical protein